jgi:hypothetical protein
MNSVVASGLAGILRGMQSAATDSARVVTSFSPDSQEDPTRAMIDLQQDALQVKASAKVVKVGDEMTKTVLDLLA